MSRRRAAGVIITAVAAIVTMFLPFIPVLEISDFKTGQRVMVVRLKNGEEFVISFTHSVNRRPVYETIRAENGYLVIVRSRFDSFGAGMPEVSTADGTLMVAKDGWLEWTVNRPVPDITVRVGWTADHTLHIKDRQIRLADLAEPGKALTIRAAKTGLIDFLNRNAGLFPAACGGISEQITNK
jgi:hypothetical protein